MLIGRQFEKDRLLSAYESEYSEFVDNEKILRRSFIVSCKVISLLFYTFSANITNIYNGNK